MKEKRYLIIAAAFLASAALSSCSNIFQSSREKATPDKTSVSEITTNDTPTDETTVTTTSVPVTAAADTTTHSGTRRIGVMDSQQANNYVPVNTEGVNHDSFKYDQLSDDEKSIYDIVCSGILHHQETIELGREVASDSFDRVYDAVLTTMDLQMYCPMRSYQCSGTDPDTAVDKLIPEYRYSAEKTDEIRNSVDDKASQIISGFTNWMSDVDKVKLIHDSIINDCTYRSIDSSASEQEIDEMLRRDDNDDAYGVLIRKQGVCEGYARAFRYVCLRAGIECELVAGTSFGEGHMWNMVKIDGAWYHIDLTWDDPIMNNSSDNDNIRYDYFNLSDSMISADHIIDEPYFQYPAADSDRANFYVYYDLYATNIEKADEIIKRELIKVYGSDKRAVFLKADCAGTLAEITDHLFEMNGLYDIMSEIQGQADYISSTQSAYKIVDDSNNTLKIII